MINGYPKIAKTEQELKLLDASLASFKSIIDNLSKEKLDSINESIRDTIIREKNSKICLKIKLSTLIALGYSHEKIDELHPDRVIDLDLPAELMSCSDAIFAAAEEVTIEGNVFFNTVSLILTQFCKTIRKIKSLKKKLLKLKQNNNFNFFSIFLRAHFKLSGNISDYEDSIKSILKYFNYRFNNPSQIVYENYNQKIYYRTN